MEKKYLHKLILSRVIEEVIIKRKKDLINKDKLSEKIKTELLNRKKKREQTDSYLTAQKIVKDYRERQKSHSNFKRKVHNTKYVEHFFDKTREGSSIIAIRITG